MALNPILNVYVIELNPHQKVKSKNEFNNFREFVKQKFVGSLISPTDEDLLKE